MTEYRWAYVVFLAAVLVFPVSTSGSDGKPAREQPTHHQQCKSIDEKYDPLEKTPSAPAGLGRRDATPDATLTTGPGDIVLASEKFYIESFQVEDAAYRKVGTDILSSFIIGIDPRTGQLYTLSDKSR